MVRGGRVGPLFAGSAKFDGTEHGWDRAKTDGQFRSCPRARVALEQKSRLPTCLLHRSVLLLTTVVMQQSARP
eukprot:scaffold20680_cov69-Skeletonema_marinoi.AAC.1